MDDIFSTPLEDPFASKLNEGVTSKAPAHVYEEEEEELDDDAKDAAQKLVPITPLTSATFEELFGGPGKSFDVSHVKDVALNTGLTPGSRGVAWKIFLEVLPAECSVSDWPEALKKKRAEYSALRDELLIDPNAADTNDDPLSQSENSTWGQFFKDEELKKEIFKDVERTCPEISFFEDKARRDLLLRVLFIWAKQNDDVSYRQGMHEILAPMVYVLEVEKRPSEDDATTSDGILATVLNEEYVEHDVFFMFSRVMKVIKPYFQPTPRRKRVPGQTLPPETSSPVIRKCREIQNVLLRKHMEEVVDHLDTLGIEPQLYALKWLRLLCGREFPLGDVLVLWDGLFADSADLDLLDHICVAMLLFMGTDLLDKEYAQCLQQLMRFPACPDVRVFTSRAITLRAGGEVRTQKPRRAAPVAAPTPTTPRLVAQEPPARQPRGKVAAVANIFNPVVRSTKTEDGQLQSRHLAEAEPSPSPRGMARRLSAAKPPEPEGADERMQRHLQDMILTNEQLGNSLDKIVSTLQAEMLSNSMPDQEVVYMSIAGLKQIKDFMLGNLPYDPAEPTIVHVPEPKSVQAPSALPPSDNTADVAEDTAIVGMADSDGGDTAAPEETMTITTAMDSADTEQGAPRTPARDAGLFGEDDLLDDDLFS